MAKKRNNRKGQFSILANTVQQDNRLSYKARGLFCFMWSKPDGWDFTEDKLALASEKDGKAAVRSALKELIEYSYLYRTQIKSNTDGKFSSEMIYELYEDPKDNPHYPPQPDLRKSQNGTDLRKSKDGENDAFTDLRLSEIGKSQGNIITDTYKTQRDILLLRQEITEIFDEYYLLHSEIEQKYLLSEKDNIVNRLVFNIDPTVKSKKRYVTTTVENEIRKFYAIEDLNKYSKNNINEINQKEFTEEDKKIAKLDWNTALEYEEQN